MKPSLSHMTSMPLHRYLLLGMSHEKHQLIEQIARLYSDFFKQAPRRPLFYQWRLMPAFELRRVHANWQALLKRYAAKRARADKLSLFPNNGATDGRTDIRP